MRLQIYPVPATNDTGDNISPISPASERTPGLFLFEEEVSIRSWSLR